MTRDLPLDESVGMVVLAWKTSEDGLLFRLRGQAEDVRLICRCGRCHWIVHEDPSWDGAVLDLICHHCGTRVTVPIERAPVAVRRP